MNINGLGAGTGQSTKSDTALSQLSQDYTRFIKLLIAQVENQDPLKPMDSTEFVSQIAQLTQVEQAVQTNSQLESLRSSLSVSTALSETQLIGREVTTRSDNVVLDENGAVFFYELESDATEVAAVISDAHGNIVRQIGGLSGASGDMYEVVWNGTSGDGDLLANGEYKITMATSGGSGGYNTYTSSVVQSVEFGGDGQMLRLADGRLASSADIVRAR